MIDKYLKQPKYKCWEDYLEEDDNNDKSRNIILIR